MANRIKYTCFWGGSRLCKTLWTNGFTRTQDLATMRFPSTTQGRDRSPCASSQLRSVDPRLTTLHVLQSTPSQITNPAGSVLSNALMHNLKNRQRKTKRVIGTQCLIPHLCNFFLEIHDKNLNKSSCTNPEGDKISKTVPPPLAYPYCMWSSRSTHVAA